jgi:hypothetical protein
MRDFPRNSQAVGHNHKRQSLRIEVSRVARSQQEVVALRDSGLKRIREFPAPIQQ